MMTNARAFDRMTDVIGATPVVRLAVAADQADVWVKVEGGNPTGSYKDRMALAMIEEAERRNDLRPGMTVVEYTGGSTGSSLALVCAVKGYRRHVVSSDAFAEEKLNTMRALGADLTVVPSDGSITRDLIETVISTAEEYAAEPDTYYTNQLENRDQVSGYRAWVGSCWRRCQWGSMCSVAPSGPPACSWAWRRSSAPRAHRPGSSGWKRRRALC